MTAPGDPIGDTLSGEQGDDRFHVRDGEVDKIDCGSGDDVVLADPFDQVVDARQEEPNGSCEKVVRAEPRPGDDASENETESPPEDSQNG